MQVVAPVEAEPPDIALDGVDELLLFLDRVGVVEPQVTASAVLFRHPEVQADRLGVAQVQVAVRLRRKPGDDRLHSARFEVSVDLIADEILTRSLVGRGGGVGGGVIGRRLVGHGRYPWAHRFPGAGL